MNDSAPSGSARADSTSTASTHTDGGSGSRQQWTAPEGVTTRRAWAALAVLLIGLFMSLLDTTIVNVAIPTLRDSINATESTLAWIISGYALAFGLLLIPAGRIGDRFGHKWVFFSGLALFIAASAFAGLAQDPTQLVIARVLQGLGGGIFFPSVTAYIQLLFPPANRGKAFAVLGAVLGVSSALGPVVGGLIIQAFGEENGWRYIFFVNLPIGVIGLIAAIIVVPAIGGGTKSSADVLGLVLLASALVALLVPLIQGQDEGWPAWTFVSLAGGAVLMVVFALWERRVARSGRSALVPPHLFSHPAFTGGVLLAVVYFAAFTSIFFTISLLWQAGLGNSALATGLVSIPFAIGNILGAALSDRLAQKLGRTVLIIGASMVAVGLLALWVILLTVDGADLTGWILLAPLAIAGVGNGFFIAPNTRFIVATVDSAEAGAASGVIGTIQRVGSAVGIAVVSSVLFAIADLGSVAEEIKSKVGQAMADGLYATPDTAADAISQVVLAQRFTDAATVALFVSAMFAVVAVALIFVLPRRVATH